jgi:hypothetical protein
MVLVFRHIAFLAGSAGLGKTRRVVVIREGNPGPGFKVLAVRNCWPDGMRIPIREQGSPFA